MCIYTKMAFFLCKQKRMVVFQPFVPAVRRQIDEQHGSKAAIKRQLLKSILKFVFSKLITIE